MSKERPIDEGFQGDHFEEARKSGRWSRITNRGAAGALGAGGVGAAGLAASGKPELGVGAFGVSVVVAGIGKAASMFAGNEQEDHIEESAKDIDDDSRRFFGD